MSAIRQVKSGNDLMESGSGSKPFKMAMEAESDKTEKSSISSA